MPFTRQVRCLVQVATGDPVQQQQQQQQEYEQADRHVTFCQTLNPTRPQALHRHFHPCRTGLSFELIAMTISQPTAS